MFKKIFYPRFSLAAGLALSVACDASMKDGKCGRDPSCVTEAIDREKDLAAAVTFSLDISASIPLPIPPTCFPVKGPSAWLATSSPWQIKIPSQRIVDNGNAVSAMAQQHQSRCDIDVSINNFEAMKNYITDSLLFNDKSKFLLSFVMQALLQNVSPNETNYQDRLVISTGDKPDVPLPSTMLFPLDSFGGPVENFTIKLLSTYSTAANGNEIQNLSNSQKDGTLLNTMIFLSDINLRREIPPN